MDMFNKKLQETKVFYENTLRRLRAERNTIAPGALHVRRQKDKIYYSERHGSSVKGITRDKERICQLARRSYIDQQIESIEKELQTIKACMLFAATHSQPQIGWKDLNTRYQGCDLDVRQALWTAEQYARNQKPSENPYHPEDLKIKTKSGVYVRTLSEQLFRNIYHELRIPVQYEPRISVDVTGLTDITGADVWNGHMYKDYYPDFVPVLAGKELYIHEHFGLIDKEGYRSKAGEKIVAYTSSGLVPPDHLILTFPKDVQDPSEFRRFLEQVILPKI